MAYTYNGIKYSFSNVKFGDYYNSQLKIFKKGDLDRKIASKCDVDSETVRKWRAKENNTSPSDIKMIEALAEFFNIEPTNLLNEEREKDIVYDNKELKAILTNVIRTFLSLISVYSTEKIKALQYNYLEIAMSNYNFFRAPDEIRKENTEPCPVEYDVCIGYIYENIKKATRQAKIELIIAADEIPQNLTDSIDELIEKISFDRIEDNYETTDSFDFELSSSDIVSLNISLVIDAARTYYKQFSSILKPYGFKLDENMHLFY